MCPADSSKNVASFMVAELSSTTSTAITLPFSLGRTTSRRRLRTCQPSISASWMARVMSDRELHGVRVQVVDGLLHLAGAGFDGAEVREVSEMSEVPISR